MINSVKINSLIFILFLLTPVFVFAQIATPPGVDITLDSLLDTTKSIAGWLIVAGTVLAGITLIVTGIMYLMSGGNSQKVSGALNMFKAGMIGALIIFAPGVVINLISGFSTNPFGFFGGGGSPTSTSTPTPTSVADTTYSCSSSGSCVPTSGGIYADSTCAGQCGGAAGVAAGGACYSCTAAGGVWCLVTASCLTDELSCPGVFTKVSGGCP